MDLGTVISLAQAVFTTLQCPEVKELFSFWGYQSDLEKLKLTVNTVKASLLDAESKQVHAGLSHQAQLWVSELKDVVYDADDLLDEFLTLVEQKKLIKGVYRFNTLVARKMSQGVKKIRAKFDIIANNHDNFGFKFDSRECRLDCQPTPKRKEETCSYGYEQHIVGREDDKENIVGMLLDSNASRDVSFLSIVGIGGLGKTSLAQLVYNDPRIELEFHMRLWVCVSDEDCWDLKTILCKILESAKHQKVEVDLSVDHLQKELREQLVGKKYLLVLDDIWNEDRYQWLKLVEFLTCGLSGSRILVTSRSRITATIVGESTYNLKGLSQEDSWLLFQGAAFGHEHEQVKHLELVAIGREIVKRCGNVPLAIRVVGSLLYGQGKEKWLSFKEVGLGRIKQGQNGIEPVLKLSYNHLEFPIKICFSYCAIFPKDFVIEKEKLISLWMAQGYVVPLDEGQSIEDAAEEYFLILSRRCFFQDVRKDEDGEIMSCKIHDLMHDIAQQVAGEEISVANSISSNLNKEIRHLFHLPGDEGTKMYVPSTKIRTYLQYRGFTTKQFVGTLVAKWMCLRALDLSYSRLTSLPSTLGKLLHLRYLDLSGNCDIQFLPNSITKLHNLQTLILEGCSSLKELPKDLSKLTKLRVLDTTDFICLVNMPIGIGKLSYLRKLPFVVVSDSKGHLVDELEEIKALQNLKGNLCIWIYIPTNADYYIPENDRKGGYLSEHVNRITIRFIRGDVRTRAYDEAALFEELRPHPSMQEMKIDCYYGERMPNWANFLPNLVILHLTECHRLQHLTSMGKMPKLKFLVLNGLSNMEYVVTEESIFPSLEELTLKCLIKLKGWSRGNDDTFPCVSYLKIMSCPNLASMPLCYNVEALELGICNANLRLMTVFQPGKSKLRSVYTTNAKLLKLVLPMEAFQKLEVMDICLDGEMESLSEIEEVFLSCSHSLRNLKIRKCSKLKSLCGGVEHLTVLEKLEMAHLSSMTSEEDNQMPWCFLTALESLQILDCRKMELLPTSIQELTSLRHLEIEGCSTALIQRCQDGIGKD